MSRFHEFQQKKNRAREHASVALGTTTFPWKRNGWFYEWRTVTQYADPKVDKRKPCFTWEYTRRLGFISYHLIRLIHGKEKLKRMGYDQTT